MSEGPKHRPGDIILDHFVPHLTGTDRELARERLQGLAQLMLRIAIRKVEEDMHRQDSHESDSRRKIQPTP